LTVDHIKDLVTVHSAVKEEITETICEEIAVARDIDDDEAEGIRMNIRSQVDISKEQVRTYEKYRLRADYHFQGEINAKFVRTYRDPKVRRVFKNLLRIKSDPDPQKAVVRIQEEERAVYNHSMQGEVSTQYSDINRRYVFDQHRYAIGLLQLCGWKTLEDKGFIHTVLLAETLRQRERAYWDVIDAACREFQMKAPSRIEARVNHANDGEFIKVLIKPVSKILNTMYGVRIVTKQKDPDMWYLHGQDWFTMNPALADKKPLLKLPEFVGGNE
jgi:hypothetical protein